MRHMRKRRLCSVLYLVLIALCCFTLSDAMCALAQAEDNPVEIPQAETNHLENAPPSIHIEETKPTHNTINFAIRPILPSNQIDWSHGYFDLRMSPAQEQTIEVEVVNRNNYEIEVIVDVSGAFSNAHGVIQYSAGDKEVPQIKRFSEILTTERPTLKIPANGSEIAQFLIKMPAEEYDGMILGGITFTKVPEMDSEVGGFGIRSKYAYTVAVVLTQTDIVVEPQLELNSIEQQSNTAWGPALQITLNNTARAIAKPIQIAMRIYTSDDLATPIFDQHIGKDIAMAPNSEMRYMHLIKEALPPGQYIAQIDLLLNEGAPTERLWSFEKPFEIEQTQ